MIENIQDIVYVIPELFDKSKTKQIAEELEHLNHNLVDNNRPYMLVVFGRLGSSDPWLGIPVEWGQISGVKVIVEAGQEGMNVEMSQGSHFFHNLTSLMVSYFSVPKYGNFKIDFSWLGQQTEVTATPFVRHIQLADPLEIKIDGRTGKGVIYK